jgi:hypothetical protein
MCFSCTLSGGNRMHKQKAELLCIWSPLRSSAQSSWLQIGDELYLPWGTSWIYICYVEISRPSLWSSGQSSWLQNGEVLCFLWGTNWIYICYVEESRSSLCSSGQSSWLQIGEIYCASSGVRTNLYMLCRSKSMLRGVPVPTAWRVLGLRMEERPPDMVVSCKYIE